MFANISNVIAQVKAGKLNAVAVTTAKRSTIAPEVPTLAGSGYPEFAFATWQAVVAPQGLPREIVDRLNAEIRKALDSADVKAQLLGFGTEATSGTPEELARLLVSEVAKIESVDRSVKATRE